MAGQAPRESDQSDLWARIRALEEAAVRDDLRIKRAAEDVARVAQLLGTLRVRVAS